MDKDISGRCIRQINARYEGEPEITFEGSDEKVLTDLCKYILGKDPDILVSPKQHYQSTGILRYLFARIEELGIDIKLARHTNKKIEGRLYLDSVSSTEVLL